MAAPALPALPLAPWADTKETLHRYAQIVGKVRLALMPYRNHWWNVPLYVTSCGLGTGPMPRGDGNFSIDFDFQQHCLLITCSNGEHLHFHLQDGLTVADFYSELMANLKTLGAEAEIAAVPYELSDHIPFARTPSTTPMMPRQSAGFMKFSLGQTEFSSDSAGSLWAKSAQYISSGTASTLP